MADELSVVIKTKLELDQAQAQGEIDKASKLIPKEAIKLKAQLDESSKSSIQSSVEKIKPKNPIKIVGKLDTVATRSNINSAIADIKITKPIKVALDVNKSESLKNIRAAISSMESSLSKNTIKSQVAPAKPGSKPSTGRGSNNDIDYDELGRARANSIATNQLKRIQAARDVLNSSSYNSKNTPGFQSLVSELDAVEKKYHELIDSFESGGLTKDPYHELVAGLKNVDVEFRKAINTSNKFSDDMFSGQDISKVEQTVAALKNRLAELKAGLGDLGSNSQITSMIAEFENSLQNVDAINLSNVQSEWKNLTSAIKLAKTEAENAKNSMSVKGLKMAEGIGSEQLPKIDQLKQMLDTSDYGSKNTPGFQSLYAEIDRLKSEYLSLQEAFKNEDLNASQYDELGVKLKTVDSQLSKLKGTVSQFDGSMKSQQGLEKMAFNIQKLKSSFSDMKANWSQAMDIPELRSQIDEFEVKLQSIDAVNYPQLQAEFQALRSNIRAAGADSMSFGDQLNSLFKQFGGFVSLTSMFMKGRQVIGEMVQDVKQLNTAMTEIRKLTDLPEDTYDSFLKDAADRAKAIGTDYAEYVSGTADYIRLGYNIGDAQELSEVSNILYRIGDNLDSVSASSDAVIASMKAFGVEAEDAMTIVDKITKVGNTTSISSGGIAEILTLSGSAMAEANNTLEQTIALGVAANETVRDTRTVGNALKTMSLRIRGAETDLQAMGEETDEFTASTSKLREELKKLTGVDIMIDNKTFKSTYQIIDELEDVWSKLSDVSQANVTEILGGKRQANVISSAIQNFDQAEKAMQMADSSAGYAMQAHDEWAQSIEASEQRATAAFQEFSNAVVSSDVVKGYYDAKAGILGFLTDLIDKTGTAIPLVASLAAGLLSAKSNFGISIANMPYPTLDDLGAVA